MDPNSAMKHLDMKEYSAQQCTNSQVTSEGASPMGVCCCCSRSNTRPGVVFQKSNILLVRLSLDYYKVQSEKNNICLSISQNNTLLINLIRKKFYLSSSTNG